MAKNEPNYAKMSPGEIADSLGQIKAEVADLTTTERALKNALIDKGVPEAEGERFKAVVFEQSRSTLNLKAVVKKLGEAWVKRNSTTSHSTVVKVTARARAD